MSITMTANYQETLPAQIVEMVDYLIDSGEELVNILSTLDYFGEEYYGNIEEIIECLNDTGADRSELYDFVDEHGITNMEYFEKYKVLVDDYGQGAIDAYIELYGVEYLSDFEDRYEGYYNTIREFVEDMMDNMGTEIPSWVCVDYEATWETALRYDYDEEQGYYFRSN